MRCVDCSDVKRPLFQYCEMDTYSVCIALASDTIDDIVMLDRRQHYFRNRYEWLSAECCDKHEDDYVQTRISPDYRGQPPRRVASRAKRTTGGHPVYLRSSGVATDSLDCVVRPTTVLVPPISTARRASASVITPSTKTPSSPC